MRTAQRSVPVASVESLESRQLLAADVYLSEFMAANQKTLDDGFGSSADWAELHNRGDSPADLSGYHLSDDEDNLSKWSFPEGTQLEAGQFLVVFASGFDTVDPQGNLHTNFRLNPAGDYLALTDASGVVVSDFGGSGDRYPTQFADIAYGINEVGSGFLETATPGESNAAQLLNHGPSILEATKNIAPQPVGQDLVITARIEENLAPVESVRLTYRIMYGDPIEVAMHDNGDSLVSGDELAGDNVFSAIIPATEFQAGQMVRWLVSSNDSQGNASRSPANLDQSGTDQSPEYFGTVVVDAAVQSNLNVWQWFLDPANERRADTTTGARSALYYHGEFYDNIYTRLRGGSSAGQPKKSYKFAFNTGHDFRFHPDFGRVREINLNTTYSNKDYIRQALTFETYDAVGLPGSEAFPVRVQRNGEFFSVAIVIEQPDADFLEREGLDPEGALYKMFNRFQRGTAEKKTRTFEDASDLNSVIDPVNSLEGEALRNFIFDNFNIPDLLNYLAVTVITQNNDQMAKNYFAYRDTNGTGEWSLFPWDVDLTFGLHFMSNDNILDDTIWADKDGFTTFANVTIWPSHPFVGDESHPGNRSWNRLMDAVYRVPEFREMYLRRLRTLMDDLLQPPETPADQLKFEARLDAYVEAIGPDVQLDYEKWANPWRWGEDQSLQQAIDRIKTEYLAVRRMHLYETHSVDNMNPIPPQTLTGEFPQATYFVPSDDSLGSTWTELAFDDSSWQSGSAGFGFENTPRNYVDLIKTRVKPIETAADATGIFVRVPFSVADPTAIEELTLRMRYDDGFVAYLNGQEIQRSNLRSDGPQSFDSRARGRTTASSLAPEDFIVSPFKHLLQPGENLLAIHIVNSSDSNSDLMVVPELLDGAIKTTDVAGIPHAQPDTFTIRLSDQIEFAPVSGNEDEEFLVVENPNDFAVDVSGWELVGSAHTTLRSGVVIPAQGKLYLSPNVAAFRARTEGPRGGQGNLVQAYSGHLANQGDTLRLLNPQGELIASVTYTGSDPTAQQSLRIAEINYNPYPAMPQFGELETDNDSFEFIEIENTGDQVVPLANAKFVELERDAGREGIAFTFGEINLPPGERITVVKNVAAFESRYGTGVRIAGEFTGKLSNGGETLTLVDANDDTIQQFRYNDRNGWPTRADGSGSSLVVINTAGDLNDSDNWRPSASFLGDPGRASANPAPSVVINEIDTRTTAPAVDRIELFNRSTTAIDISNWWLTDSSDPFKFQFSAGTTIAPGEFLVLDETQLGFGFKGNQTDNAILTAADADGRPLFFADAVEFQAAEEGKSWSRSPNGTGPLVLQIPTIGAANQGPRNADFNDDALIDSHDIDLLCQTP